MNLPYHELFLSNQRHLLQKHFQPTEEQLQNAKQSLIEKHKMANGVQHLLFCRSGKEEEEFMNSSSKEMIEGQRKRYMDFIRKNYNQRIPDELSSLNKLKARIKEFEEKTEEQRKREEEEENGNKKGGRGLMKEEVFIKKRQNENVKVEGGKKKVKGETKKQVVAKQTKKGKKQQVKGKIESPKFLQKEVQQQQNGVSDSLQLDLLNSLSNEDQFENNYGDDDQ